MPRNTMLPRGGEINDGYRVGHVQEQEAPGDPPVSGEGRTGARAQVWELQEVGWGGGQNKVTDGHMNPHSWAPRRKVPITHLLSISASMLTHMDNTRI